ncbi:hypothetical protein A9P82_02790 [Arachidicoccus ginsenosidimutans]|nr:hypothetical protein A9P82_02790 [Arachidicoccus sp. BS20]
MKNGFIKTVLLIILITRGFVSSAQENRKELLSSKTAKNKIPYSVMSLSAQYIGTAISDSNWYNWCISPLQTKDGKIHIFGSRWPKKDGMEGWTGPKAEIAHFVSDKPEGPFKYVGTIMKTAMLPDTTVMAGPHNPRLEYVDGKYILLYICQNPTIGSKGQRIGMMIADNINGPWRFAGNNKGIMVEPSKDPSHWTYNAAIGADNPAFLKIGKKYYIYYKCGTPEQMKAKYGYAVSDKLEGPYVLCDEPITDNVSYLEDAQAFAYKKNYYLLTADNLGGNTGIYGDLILWKSATGLSFKLADAQIAMGNIFDYWGTPQQKDALLNNKRTFVRDVTGKFERPAVLFIKGKPAYFYAVADVNIHGLSVSESYIFKINWK